jgi:hypothetical protein
MNAVLKCRRRCRAQQARLLVAGWPLINEGRDRPATVPTATTATAAPTRRRLKARKLQPIVSTAELLVREHAYTDTREGDVIAYLIQLVCIPTPAGGHSPSLRGGYHVAPVRGYQFASAAMAVITADRSAVAGAASSSSPTAGRMPDGRSRNQ